MPVQDGAGVNVVTSEPRLVSSAPQTVDEGIV